MILVSETINTRQQKLFNSYLIASTIRGVKLNTHYNRAMFQQIEQYRKYMYAPHLPTLTPHTLSRKTSKHFNNSNIKNVLIQAPPNGKSHSQEVFKVYCSRM